MHNSSFLLSYTDTGQGNPLVLIHGFLESHAMWDFLHLKNKFRLIIIDLPGHGASKSLPPTTSIDEMAECLKLTLDSLQIANFDMVGHSLGGYVGLSYLEKFPFSGKFVLLNSNPWSDDFKKKADRLRVANLALLNKKLLIREAIPGLFSNAKETKTEIDQLIQEAFEIPAEHIASTSVAMRNRKDLTEVLEKNAKKISILQGENDTICPLERMEIISNKVNVNLVIIPNAGHMSHIENSAFVSEKLIRLFTS